MADAPLVIDGAVAGAPPVGSLFAGYKFFLVQRIPSRGRFVADIEANGGIIVRAEKTADYIIADHLRADAPAGSYSYTFIETAIRTGKLPDPSGHTTGRPAGAVREVSSTIPARTTRTPFTAEDDRALWYWVERAKVNGGKVKGLEIYKGLEAVNPRHTFQAWRDRYVKRLMDHPPGGVRDVVSTHALPSPALSADGAEQEARPSPRKRRKVDHNSKGSLSNAATMTTREQDDTKLLEAEADSIESVPEGLLDKAWAAFADVYAHRDAHDWKAFYNERVRPLYLAKRSRRHTETIQDQPVEDSLAGPSHKRNPYSNQSHNPAAQQERTYTHHSSASLLRQKSLDPRKLRRLDMGRRPPDDHPQPHDNRHADAEVIKTESSREEVNAKSRCEEEGRPGSQSSGKNDLSGEKALLQASMEGQTAIVQGNSVDNVSFTSDVNQAAEEQIQYEAEHVQEIADAELGSRNTHSTGHGPDNVSFDTYEINSPVGEQMQQETTTQAITPQQVIPAKTRQPDVCGREWDSMVASTVATAIKAIDAALVHAVACETEGFALTAANLAAQEAQLKGPVARGIDLPEDDEMQDQTRFAGYLQQILGVRPPLPHVEDVPNDQQEGDVHNGCENKSVDEREEDWEPLSSPFHVPGESPANAPPDNVFDVRVHTMPQEDIEDVLELNMDWPSSPQQRRARAQHGRPHDQILSQQLAQKSSLSGEDEDVAQPDLDFTGRSLLSHIDQTTSQAERDDDAYEGQSPAELISQTGQPHRGHGDLTEAYLGYLRGEDVESKHLQNEEAGDDDESGDADIENEDMAPEEGIDLTIAEPEGGFSLESSPGRPIHPFDTHQQYREPDRNNEAVGPESKRNDESAIEISSASPPSSSIGSPVPSAQGSELSEPNSVRGAHAVETQDIFRSEAQRPDVFMPLPPDTDDEEGNDQDQTLGTRRDGKSAHSPWRQSRMLETRLKTELESDLLAEAETESDSRDQEEELESWMATMKVRGFEEPSIIRALKCTTMQPDLAEFVLVTEKSGKAFPGDVPGVWSEEEDGILESGNARGIKRLDAKHGWDECEARRKYLEEWREL